MNSKNYSKPVIFGEVLIDLFPDEEFSLGGAPFNVAWHLNGFGAHPLFISAVSNDKYGRFILQSMKDWGMDCSGIQITGAYPTGRVNVSFIKNEPSFNIAANQAYDHIDSDQCFASLNNHSVSLFYFGSLAQREENNRNIIKSICGTFSPLTFTDINLRPPWWSHKLVLSLMEDSDHVKMNIDEFKAIAGIDHETSPDWQQACSSLIKDYNLKSLIVTDGSNGSHVFDTTEFYHLPAARCGRFIDSVGAGDAFSAVIILGILNEWKLIDTVRNAGEFAAYICGIQGAICYDKKIYADFLRKWNSKVL